MASDDWLTPAIRRTDGESFYLALADFPERRRLRTKNAPTCLLAVFHYVLQNNPDTIERTAVLLTQRLFFFATLENQLRRTANELAKRLSSGSALSEEYRFDGSRLSEMRLAMELA